MSPNNLINSSSVILATGGARGITARCVVELAERSHANFILLGRSSLDENIPDIPGTVQEESEIKRRIVDAMQAQGEKPTPQKVQRTFRSVQSRREIEETIHAVESAGGHAEYISADITDAAALQQKLAEPVHRLGPVTGIIHGAGSLADKLIEKKSEKDFETVYSPKINGLDSLLQCVPARQLDFLVLFSSIVGVYGNIGQSDYAIANEVLNKSAYLIKRSNPDCRVISINWGPWDTGMVTPELKKIFEERNVEIIPAELGAKLLAEELTPNHSGVIQMVVGAPPARPAAAMDSELRTYQIHRNLKLDENPFLQDHRIGGNPVLPATCAAVWVASACEQLYPGMWFSQLVNFKVLKGIVFDDNLAKEHVLELKETVKSADEVSFDALIWSKNARGKTIYHYSLAVTLVRELPQPAEIFTTIAYTLESNAIPGSELYRNGTLFHGPAFQGVEQVLHISRGKLVMECTLPRVAERHQGQFPVQTGNPYIYDAIVQSLLIWSQFHYQAPCLPSRLARLEQYRPIPFDQPTLVTMEIKSQSETNVTADLLVQGMDGSPYARFIGLEGTISPALNRFIGIRPGTSS